MVTTPSIPTWGRSTTSTPSWATAHPEWFTTRADGSIAYAENPPRKYQDIYPLDFEPVHIVHLRPEGVTSPH